MKTEAQKPSEEQKNLCSSVNKDKKWEILSIFAGAKHDFDIKQWSGLSLAPLERERKVRATQSIAFLNGKLGVTSGLR